MAQARLVTAALLLSLAVAAAPACSDSTTGEADGNPNADVTETPVETPIEYLTVQTGVSDDGPRAGEVVRVFCNVEGLAAGQEPPETRWEFVEQPSDLSLEPLVDGDEVTFRQVGEYRLRCEIVATGWSDSTPVRVLVSPGPATTVETTVSPSTLTAGSTADVICEGADEFGNAIDDDWFVGVAPGGPNPGIEGGLVEANMLVKGITIGTYDVACAQKFGGPADETPAVVTVQHGLPNRIVTILEEEEIVAGYATKVSCRAEDKQGNEVPDLPMTIDLPSGLQLVGFDVTTTKTGSYVVKCVPAGLEWSAFNIESAVLKVVPDLPVTLSLGLLPPKPFFAMYEVFQLLVIAEDQYGNAVPEAEVNPVVVTPTADYKEPSPLNFLFKEEGVFTLSTSLANDASVQASIEVPIEGSPPTVTVTYPPRGATLTGTKPSVTVEGIAQDEIAGIAQVTVNGVPAKLNPDGTFTKIIIPKWGLNMIYVEAEDGGGTVTTILQSFYFSDKWYGMEPNIPYIPDALKLWLSENFIDDGVHNPTHPDDMATILESVIGGLDLSSALGSGTEIGLGYELQLKNISYNPPKLNLDPTYGGMNIYVDIKNLLIKVKLVGECKVLGVDLCPDFSGSVGVDKILLDAFLKASAEAGLLDIELLNPNVKLEHIDVTVDGILGWLFDWLIDFLVNIFSGTIEDLVEDQLDSMLGDTLADLFTSLAISETFEIDGFLPGMDPISLTLDSKIWSLAFAPEGGRVGLGARMLAPKNIPQKTLGSIGRGTCLKGLSVNWTLPGGSEFELGVWDDFLNELLTSVWFAGTLNLSMDETTLGGDGGFDLAGLPIDGLQITTNFLLPPIVNGCSEDGYLRLQIGDMFLDAELESLLFEGGVGKMGTYIAIELKAELLLVETDEGTALSLIIHELETLEFHWEYVPIEFEGSEDVLEDLLKEQLVDQMLADMIGEPLFEFVIPEFNLGDLSPELGGELTIVPQIDDLTREGGHTLVQGQLE